MEEKSYNPFKMWGAWVGAVAGFIFCVFSWYPIKIFNIIFNINILEQPEIIVYIVVYGFWVIIGFLMGWGIHSLVRKLKK